MTTTWRVSALRARARGFTIIELLVAVVVLAVLMGVALPSMREFLLRSSLSSAAWEIHSAVARARQEAITRGTFVSVIPQSSSGWESGYRVFVNPLNKATYSAGDIVGSGTSSVTSQILVERDGSSWDYVTWPSLTSDGKTRRDYYTFDDTGRPRNSDGSNMRPSDPSRVRMCVDSSNCRELIVDHLGRIQIVKN